VPFHFGCIALLLAASNIIISASKLQNNQSSFIVQGTFIFHVSKIVLVVDKSTYKNLKIKRETKKEEENPKLKT